MNDLVVLSRATVHYFYRAMLCIAQTMPSRDVCLSVTRRYSVKMAKHNLELFSASGNHVILVFFNTKRYDNIPTGTPFMAVECKGGGLKKSRFLANISLYHGKNKKEP